MEVIEAIQNRRSTRTFLEQAVEEEKTRMLLESAMDGPNCVNSRDWCFLVVTDREKLDAMADANGRPAAPLKGAPLAVMVCGDLSRSFPPAKDYWVIDCAIAAQNITLCAEGLGLGSVWLGTWPQMDRVKKQANLFGLPEHIVPHSILAIGYPTGEKKPRESRFENDRVHYNVW